jgi:tape measure domain-containing protein
MAEDVKNVLFRIQADTGQLRRELDAIKSGLGTLGPAAKGAENQISGLRKTLTGAAAAFGGISVAASAIDFGKGAITAVADFEKVQISLETFLGSAEKAKEVFADLEKFSIETPFTPEEVNQAGKALLAFGEPVDNLTTALQRIGDVSAATGKNFNELAVIYGKARVQGVLFAEDINQLTEAGVPIIGEFAKQLGVSESEVKKLGSEGRISFANLEEGFKSLTGEGGRFAGLTERLSQSTAGRLSTLDGEFEKLKRTVGEGLLPVFENVVSGAFNFINAIARIPAFVEEYGRTLTLLGAAVAFYVGQQNKAIQAELISNAQKLISIARERALTVATAIGNGIKRTAAGITGLLTRQITLQTFATNAATAATRGFNAVLRSNPLGLIASLAATAAAFFLDFGDSVEESTGATEQLLNSQTALAQSQKETNAETAKEIASLESLVSQIKKSNNGSTERQKLIDQLNSKYGTTLKNISDETKFISNLDSTYQRLANSIKAAAQAEAVRNAIVKLSEQKLALEQQRKILDAEKEKQNVIDANAQKQKQILEEQRKAGDLSASDLIEQSANIDVAARSTRRVIDAQIEASDKALANTQKSIDELATTAAQSTQKTTAVTNTATKSVSNLGQKQRELFQDLTRDIEKLNRELSTQKIELTDPKTFNEEKQKIRDLGEERKKAIDEDFAERVSNARKEGTLTTKIQEQFDELKRLQKLKVTNETEKQITDIVKEETKRRSEAESELSDIDVEKRLNKNAEILEEEKNQRELLLDQFAKARSEKERESIRQQLQSNLDDIRQSINEEESIRIKQIEDRRDKELQDVSLIEDERKVIVAQAELDILQIRKDASDQYLNIKGEESKTTEELEKQRRDDIIKGIEEVIDATKQLTNAILDASIKQTEIQISAQEKRVEKAREIAEKGNAELLQAEEDRLTALNEKRAKFVRAQQALAAIELVANSAVAISKAAAEGGAAAPFTIAATLIALAAGLVAAKAQAQAAAGSFAEGGFTGEGGKYQTAGIVHKGEFVFTKEKTRKYRPLFEAIHAGRDPYFATGLKRNESFSTRTMETRLEKIEKAIREQKGLNLSIDENGINGIVTSVQYKQNRIRNKAR